ncbi:hypothetical protein Psfp_01327 [Pelotomaculum sp. FP]|uniref:hypothetical protein n=1 Tax=Pelotomaculum sp. FP TaxID=261474 RepID=UPI0010663F5A|nr:hypothetical protein [Pelotomaculum sp. FP]TEB16495.1 hypothetical protein Psfp_01327 [Pelotomaculum sp. FP]
MKKTFCILAVMFMFSLFTYGCGNAPDITDGIKNVNDSIQNVNKAVQDVNKSIQDTGNQISPNKEDNGAKESGAKDNKEDSEEDSEED